MIEPEKIKKIPYVKTTKDNTKSPCKFSLKVHRVTLLVL